MIPPRRFSARRPTSSSACVLAVFVAIFCPRTCHSSQMSCMACAPYQTRTRTFAAWARCWSRRHSWDFPCAVLIRPTGECASSASRLRGRPALSPNGAHVSGHAIRCCGSGDFRLRPGGFWPRRQAVLNSRSAPLKLGYEGPLRGLSRCCLGLCFCAGGDQSSDRLSAT
jgi:hypothetical protein